MEKDFTKRVLDAYSKIDNARLKDIIQILIKHLHACITEMKLTDKEFEFTWDFLERMAKFTGPERNEYLLFADVVGVSQLVEIVNHSRSDQSVGFALVGPYLREGAP